MDDCNMIRTNETLIWLAPDHAHVLKEMIDAPDDVDESGAFARIDAAWARQIDSDDFPHAARPGRHDNDAVGEKDRLLDAVGDKDHSLTGGLPDILQIDLQLRAGERIERAERLVHQKKRRVVDERAA